MGTNNYCVNLYPDIHHTVTILISKYFFAFCAQFFANATFSHDFWYDAWEMQWGPITIVLICIQIFTTLSQSLYPNIFSLFVHNFSQTPLFRTIFGMMPGKCNGDQ